MLQLSDDLKNVELQDEIFKDVKYYVSGDVHERVLELLRDGGATRRNYFSDYVTHLICGTDAEETDLSDANELYEIPAVTVKWVFMCARLKRLLSTKPYVFSPTKLFTNCVFCLSALDSDRNSLWAIITYHGGVVQLNLDRRCTHLLTTSTTTDKYVKAEALGPERVQIVTPDWIVESVKCNSLAQADLFHPRLIAWPKVVKHESTTAITGFEPEQSELDEKALEISVPDSTQALLDKLKQRMPWNQPQVTSSSEPAPPNIVAPSFASVKLPQAQEINQSSLQQKLFGQHQLVQQLNLPKTTQIPTTFPNTSQQQQLNILTSASQVPRSIVHHTPQSTLVNQQQVHQVQQQAQQQQAQQQQVQQQQVHQQQQQQQVQQQQIHQQQQQTHQPQHQQLPALQQSQEQQQFGINQQSVVFSQANLTANQKLNRVLEQFRQRSSIQTHLNRLNQMEQQNQFSQLQRNQPNQLQQLNLQNQQTVQVSQESQVGQQLRQVNQIVQGNQSSQLGLNLQQLSANNQQLTQRSQQLEQGGSQVAQGLQQLVQGGRLVQGGQRPQQILQGNQHLLQNQLCQMNQLGQINQPQVSQLEQAGQQSSIPQLQIAQSQQNVVQHPTLSQIAKPPTGIQQQLSHLTPEQILNRQILGQNQQINQQLMKNQQMGQNHVNQQLLQNTQQLLQNQQGHLNQQLLQNQQQIGQQQPSQLSQQQQNQLNQQQQTQLTQQQQNQINQQEQNQLNQQLSQQKQNQVAQQQQNQITQQQQNQLSQLNQQQQIQLDQLNLQQNQVCKLKQQLSQLEQQRSNQVNQQQQQNQLNQLNIQQNQLAKLNQQLSQLEQQRNQREQQRSNQVSQQQLLQNQQQLVQNQQIGQNPLEQQLVQNQLSQQLAQNQLGPRRLGLNQHLLQTQIGQQLVQTQLGQQQQQQGQLVQQQTIVQNQMNQQIGQISQQLQQNQLEQSSLTQQQQQQIRQGQHLLQSQIGQSQLPQQLGQQIAQGQLGQQQLNLQQNKLIQNQFGSQQIVNQNQQQQQQQFSNPPASTQQQFGQQGQHFSQAQQAFNQISQGSQSQLIQGQQQGQFVQGQQVVTGQQQLIKTQQPIGSQQIVPQQQMINQKLAVQQLANQPIGGQQHILINQQQQQQQQITQNPLQQFAQQENQPNQIAQPNLSNQPVQQRATAPHLWQQQQRLNIRQLNLQQQGPRVQWPPNQQQGVVPQRQFIQLDSQTHQQLQQMSPEERAQFITRLHKQRQIQLAQRMQQRGGHILIRGGPVPPGLNPQQQLQWVQQQAKQQGLVFQSNIQQNNTPVQQTANVAQNVQHAPGLSPIQQNAPFNDQSQQLQLQRQQFRIQQLQLQREQAQKTPAPAPALPPTTPVPQPSIVRPIGQPQTVDPNTAIGADPNIQQNPLVVNPKTKTALANMLSIRLQSGGSALTENIAEPSAAGTLRLMTAQHNAALNSNNRPQELLALQQRRIINRPNGDLIRPPAPPSVPPTPQGEPPKLQYSPRNTVPLQHRPGTYYGHNPNLKLPPDLFLLGCVFVVVELERFLDESLPGWQKKIEKHGGEIEKQYCNRVTHVICETQRHGVVMQALRDFKRCVTLYWLSDVIHRKQVLPPWIALHLPTMYWDTAPASKHLISLSGFTGTERERVKHMIKYIGATLTTYFSKHNTLLIVSRAEGSKCLHAKKWGVPVVNIQWLTDVMLGHFTALSQMEHIKYQQFSDSPNFSFDPVVVPTLMHAWKMPINISQESYEKVKRSASPVVFPPKAKKMKMEHHTDENDNQDNCGIFSNHRILFSMFADTTELKEIVRQLGGSLASSPKDCTHLVMPQLTRSNKLLFCICIGAHILPESWLRDSQSANKFLDESNYSLDTKEFNSVYKCDFTQTLMTKNRNKLFEGKYFYVTPSVYLGKDNLAKLIQCCGGIVERTRRTLSQIEATNINSPYSYIILTHENDLHLVADLLKNKKDKIRIVCNGELIFSAILRQTFEVEPYAVKVL